MINLNLGADEGILLESKNIIRYDQSYHEEEILEMYLTNKALLCNTGYDVVRISLNSIRIVNGTPQVRFHADDDYDDGMMVLYNDGSVHHFVFERPSEINNWVGAISNAVTNMGATAEVNIAAPSATAAAAAAQVVYVQQQNQNVSIRNKRQLKYQLEYEQKKREEEEAERRRAELRKQEELAEKEAAAKKQAQKEETRQRHERGEYSFKEKFSLGIVGSVFLTIGLILTIITEGAGFFIVMLVIGAILGGFGALRAVLLINKSNKIKSKLEIEHAEAEERRQALKQRKSAKLINCPHCGAPTHATAICEYCGGALK